MLRTKDDAVFLLVLKLKTLLETSHIITTSQMITTSTNEHLQHIASFCSPGGTSMVTILAGSGKGIV